MGNNRKIKILLIAEEFIEKNLRREPVYLQHEEEFDFTFCTQKEKLAEIIKGVESGAVGYDVVTLHESFMPDTRGVIVSLTTALPRARLGIITGAIGDGVYEDTMEMFAPDFFSDYPDVHPEYFYSQLSLGRITFKDKIMRGYQMDTPLGYLWWRWIYRSGRKTSWSRKRIIFTACFFGGFNKEFIGRENDC